MTLGADKSTSGHLCPFACSRCDITCPCTCKAVLLQEYDNSGRLVYRETRCAWDIATPTASEGSRDVSGGDLEVPR